MSEPTPDHDDAPPVLFDGGRRWGTVGLVLLNLAVGLVAAWAGVSLLVASPAEVIAFGGVDPPRVWSGEVWRLLTANFVHVGAWHLGLNLWVLWQVGRAYERLVGAARLVLVYLVSGVFGFALSVALLPGLTAGASAAVFGVTGALFAVASLTRQQRLGRFLVASLSPFVVATFALGVLVPMVNNVAHAGGLVMGFLLGYGLSAGDRSFLHHDDVVAEATALATVTTFERRAGVVALVAAFAGFAATTAYALEPRLSPRYHAVMGLRALHDVDTARSAASRDEALARAKRHADAVLWLAPDDGTSKVLVARMFEVEGKLAPARDAIVDAFATFLGDDEDRTAAFDRALLELALLDPGDEMPFVDGYTVRALCAAALDDEGRRREEPQLKNSCAWLFLRAHEPAVRDPAAALPLAREAWRETNGTNPEIAHTYACALADTGDAAEGLAVLERLMVDGALGALGAGFLQREHERLTRLAEQQARQTTQTPPPAALPPPPAAESSPPPPTLPPSFPSHEELSDGRCRLDAEEPPCETPAAPDVSPDDRKR